MMSRRAGFSQTTCMILNSDVGIESVVLANQDQVCVSGEQCGMGV